MAYIYILENKNERRKPGKSEQSLKKMEEQEGETGVKDRKKNS